MRLSEAIEALKAAGIENARGEARMIFEELCHIDRVTLSTSDPESELADEAVKRRTLREPLQYIIKKAYFFREEYCVTPDCLIPRSDTEILVEYAVSHLSSGARFIDLCTGSGCIAISTLKNTKNTSAVAVDLSEKALEIAKKNSEDNGVSKRIDLVCSDALTYDSGEMFDALLSNPPYIRDEVYKTLENEIFYEPKMALVAENDGLLFYEILVPLYKNRIKSGGFMAFEIGYDQAQALSEIAKKNGLPIKILKDYSGLDRVAVINV